MVGKTEHGVPREPAVPFGHAMRKYFALEPSYTNLNHGSYGSLPLPVLEACEEISRDIEANPDRSIRATLHPRLRDIRARLADFLGVERDECVLVPNTTHGINTVLRNLEWSKDDVIVGAATSYPSISRTIRYIGDVSPHPRLVPCELPLFEASSVIINKFREHLRSLPRTEGSKVVAVIDAIISLPGLRLPWEKMISICKEEQVISVIDAAHAIGQQVDIDLRKADPDFWVSNCHKWLYAKRGCAVLYVPKRNQHLIRTTLPTSIFYASPSDPEGYLSPPNFVQQFDWTGTIDFTPYMSVDPALNFREWCGGEQKINDYCHSLAIDGGQRLALLLGTRVMDPNGEMTANMVNVELPLRGGSRATTDRIRFLLSEKQWNISCQIYYYDGAWWVRCCAQIFNDISDFEKLGDALKVILPEVEYELRNENKN